MKHYQKIATLLIRLIGFILFIYGSMFLIFFVGARFSDFTEYYVQSRQRLIFLVNGSSYVIIGVIVFLASKPIGKIIGKGLDD